MDGYTPNSSSLLANDDLYPTTNTNTRSVGNNASAGATTNMTSSGTGINTVSHAHAGTGRIYPVVQVVAPENLSEGYTFDVEVNHEILTITVVSVMLLRLYRMYIIIYCVWYLSHQDWTVWKILSFPLFNSPKMSILPFCGTYHIRHHVMSALFSINIKNLHYIEYSLMEVSRKGKPLMGRPRLRYKMRELQPASQLADGRILSLIFVLMVRFILY
jgi:hypothetical protein